MERKQLPKICKVPSCGRILYPGNTTGVCRDHNHKQPYCECYQCTHQGAKRNYRAKTREELRDEGLLP